MFVLTPNRAIYLIRALLIFSCIAPFSHSEVEINVTNVETTFATKLKAAESWSDVFSVPKEGYRILNTMQPVPCPNLFRPSILIPVDDLTVNCMPYWIVKTVCPAHGRYYTALEMGYTGNGPLANMNGEEAAKSWILIMTKYLNGLSWFTWHKLCSIEVSGEPYLGVAMSIGCVLGGEYNSTWFSSQTHGQYFIQMCGD